jgi:hypothetical protein
MKLRTEGVSWREIDGETVILDLSSSTYLKTNAAGSTIMRLLAEERTSAELADGLVDEFGIPADQAKVDTETFIAMLRERNLLDTADS